MSESLESQDDGPDPVEAARADLYALLAMLMSRAPDQSTLERLEGMKADEASPLGEALAGLSLAASRTALETVEREYFDLFIGVGRGEFLPYASYYLTGFLHERPLAAIREDLARLGVERSDEVHEPEDHIAILCEVMAGIIAGRFPGGPEMERLFFERHLMPWADRFFRDIEEASSARFYRSVGRVGRLFMDIETQACTLPF